MPVAVLAKIDYEQKEVKNELLSLWLKLKNETIKEEFKNRIQVAYNRIEADRVMVGKSA